MGRFTWRYYKTILLGSRG